MTDPKVRKTIDSARDDMGDLQRAMLAVFSSSVTRILARVMLIVFVVKLYGLGSFGYLGETAALVELLAALASFGLPKTLLAYLDQADGDPVTEGRLISNAIALSALLGIILGTVLWLLWPLIFPPSSGVPAYAAAAVFLIATTELMLTVTRSRRVIRWDAMVKGFVKPWGFLLLCVGGYFLLVKTGIFSAVGALFAGYIASTVLALFVALFGLIWTRRKNSYALVLPDLMGMRRLFKNSFSTAIVDAGSFSFRRLDIILLGVIAGPTATGIYYLVQQLATVVEKMRHLFEPMAAPVLAQAKSMVVTSAHLKKLCLWIFSAQVGLATVFVSFAAAILGLFDAVYMHAAILMMVILMGEIAEGTSGLIELPLVFNAPAIASRNIIIALICEIGLVALGAYNFGLMGAAAGFSLAMMLLAILRFSSAHTALGLTIIDASYAKPVGAAIVAAGATIGLNMILVAENNLYLAFSVVVCLLTYLLVLRLFGLSLWLARTS
ncbi:MAG: oligosaccharide flippase family protein [Parasphingorhabdus sp.]|uniref:lipopolysaccharide biosynthesis protein n=1 Tax=Parasphingorhabdus sp. TaxID=2709688 RepID=UPI0030035A62